MKFEEAQRVWKSMKYKPTRREELLIKPEQLQRIWVLRKLLYPMDDLEAMEFLMDKLKSTKTNLDFFDSMRR